MIEEARKVINEIDREMAELFVRRMKAAREIAQQKKEQALSVTDNTREQEIIARCSAFVEDPEIREYYIDFLKSTMAISKQYQSSLIEGIRVDRYEVKKTFASCEIVVESGALDRIAALIDMSRGKTLVVTDSGVPKIYSRKVADAASEGYVLTIRQGEASKNVETWSRILSYLVENSFTRTDRIIAVGGGVVGDMAGFAAASYMRGIAFYNIPTTLLSQVDSSIGGKTAINFNGVKNIVGAFYQPLKVIIDPITLSTLSDRHLHNGLAEAIKMAATSDSTLFELIEQSHDIKADLEKIIHRCLLIKRSVVEQDPQEKGLRRVLNFGHTIGHAIEAASDGKLLHGEAVAVGMLYFAHGEAKSRIKKLLARFNLPVSSDIPASRLRELIYLDKKASGKEITVIHVREIGKFEMKRDLIDNLICEIL